MSLITVTYELRQRRVIADGEEAEPLIGTPENWITRTCSFTIQSDNGLMESPGQVVVESLTRRKLIAFAPYTHPDPDDVATYDEVTVLNGTRVFSGPEVLTDPRPLGVLNLSGDNDTPLRLFYAEGEEVANVGIWAGVPSGSANAL